MGERVAVFDVMGTLFDLSSLEARLTAAGAPPGTLATWFARLLHAAGALTLAGEFRPFPDLAAATLRSTLARSGVDPGRAGEVLPGLGELDPFPEAHEALALLQERRIAAIALTNGGAANTAALLRRSGLDAYVGTVVTTEDAGAYKPHPAPYRLALRRLGVPGPDATMVAAHAWDVMGARAAGMDAVWIDRAERVWPLPVPPVRAAADLLQAARLVAREGGPAA